MSVEVIRRDSKRATGKTVRRNARIIPITKKEVSQ